VLRLHVRLRAARRRTPHRCRSRPVLARFWEGALHWRTIGGPCPARARFWHGFGGELADFIGGPAGRPHRGVEAGVDCVSCGV
jgi:hypothetical protein